MPDDELDVLIADWWDALEDLRQDAVEHAFRRWMREKSARPWPADIRALAVEWDEVRNAKAFLDALPLPQSEEPRVRVTAEQMAEIVREKGAEHLFARTDVAARLAKRVPDAV